LCASGKVGVYGAVAEGPKSADGVLDRVVLGVVIVNHALDGGCGYGSRQCRSENDVKIVVLVIDVAAVAAEALEKSEVGAVAGVGWRGEAVGLVAGQHELIEAGRTLVGARVYLTRVDGGADSRAVAVEDVVAALAGPTGHI
jgi:hypothetical protein